MPALDISGYWHFSVSLPWNLCTHFNIFRSPVRCCPSALHGQIPSTRSFRLPQLLGPWNFPFLWCSVSLRIACSAGEENNFFLHCFISFLGNDGTYFRKVRFDLSCENWLFLLTPLLPFLLGNEGRWISVVNNSIYQHGVSLFLIPLLQIMPWYSLTFFPSSPALFPSPWRAFPVASLSDFFLPWCSSLTLLPLCSPSRHTGIFRAV